MSPLRRELIPEALAGERLDRVVALATGRSRSEVASLLDAGAVSVGGRVTTRASRRLTAGEVVEVDLPEEAGSAAGPDPTVELVVVHEDPWLVVVDKPAGLVVHPGAGHPGGTLVNGLLARYPEMGGVGDPERPGIVHRLDKGTSGLLLAARTPEAHAALGALLAARRIERRYLALVSGRPASDRGTVDAPLGRSARQPTRMTVSATGREARTGYEVRERFALPFATALVECALETGRTHQIRVHMAAIGHPVVGDSRYGRGAGRLPGLDRPFLHAYRLRFDHPAGTGPLELESPLPPDLAGVLAGLREQEGRPAGT